MVIKLNRFLFVISILFYISSLALPAMGSPMFSDSGEFSIVYGWELLLLGFMGIAFWNPAWLANLFYFTLLICTLKKPRRFDFLFAIVTFAIGLTALVFKLVENTHFYVGYYAWMLSFILLAIAIKNRNVP